jgi:hypothetical protein
MVFPGSASLCHTRSYLVFLVSGSLRVPAGFLEVPFMPRPFSTYCFGPLMPIISPLFADFLREWLVRFHYNRRLHKPIFNRATWQRNLRWYLKIGQ